jgi:transcriptional regulator NrdR
MYCPYCSHKESKVTDKRESPEGIRRRRECLKCKKRFTTYEKASVEDIYVIKKDNRREKFNREKLENGIHRAFEKRPVEKNKIDKMINEIEEQIRKTGKIVKSRHLYVQSAGISGRKISEIIGMTCTHGKIPEPIRVAHLIASGIVLGESRGRA